MMIYTQCGYAAAKVSTSLANTTFWTSKEVYDGNVEVKGKRLPVTMNAFDKSLCNPIRILRWLVQLLTRRNRVLQYY